MKIPTVKTISATHTTLARTSQGPCKRVPASLCRSGDMVVLVARNGRFIGVLMSLFKPDTRCWDINKNAAT